MLANLYNQVLIIAKSLKPAGFLHATFVNIHDPEDNCNTIRKLQPIYQHYRWALALEHMLMLIYTTNDIYW